MKTDVIPHRWPPSLPPVLLALAVLASAQSGKYALGDESGDKPSTSKVRNVNDVKSATANDPPAKPLPADETDVPATASLQPAFVSLKSEGQSLPVNVLYATSANTVLPMPAFLIEEVRLRPKGKRGGVP